MRARLVLRLASAALASLGAATYAAACAADGPAARNGGGDTDADFALVPLVPAAPLPRPLAVPGADALPPDAAPAPRPAELTVQYVQRLPAIDYVWGSANPRVDGWPAVGQRMTWRAHVRNWFPTARAVAYRWELDGREVARGTMTIPAGEVGTADYQLPWAFERHELAFVLDPENAVAEEEEHDNRVALATDALSVGFWVERSVYDWFRAHQHELPEAHADSFEDWAQRQVALYNELFARAVYPETPNGVRERLRLDRVTVVPDGALPLDPAARTVGGAFDPASARPDLADRTVDLQWGFPASTVTSLFADLRTRSINNQFYWYSGFVQHEMGHARGMIDVYGQTVYAGLPGHTVALSGLETLGTVSFPAGTAALLFRSEPGLMATDWTFLDRTSAVIWERMKGARARFGNYNSPEDLGWFLNDLLPDDVRLRFVNADGAPAAGVRVSVYQGTRPAGTMAVAYGREYDATPDVVATTDARGEASLGHNPFARAGPVVNDEGFSNATAIVRAERGRFAHVYFLTASDVVVRSAGGAPQR
jgi:hypothetical protein